MPPELHQLSSRDTDDVLRLQGLVYPTWIHEPRETFESFLRAFPEGCVGAFHQGSLCGYGFGLPWVRFEVLELNSQSLSIPSDPTTFHVHDVATHPDFRGMRIGEFLLRFLLQVAATEGLDHIELIAVGGANGYWKRFGFNPSMAGRDAEAGYGDGAVYMDGRRSGRLLALEGSPESP